MLMKKKEEKDPQIINDRIEKQDITRELTDIEIIRDCCEKDFAHQLKNQEKWKDFLKDTN